jgi:hypothetical protein
MGHSSLNDLRATVFFTHGDALLKLGLKLSVVVDNKYRALLLTQYGEQLHDSLTT